MSCLLTSLLSGLPTLTSGSVSRVAATLARFDNILKVGELKIFNVDPNPCPNRVLTQDIMGLLQVYAIRQALSKSLVAYYQKYVDEQSKQEIKDILVQFDRSVLS